LKKARNKETDVEKNLLDDWPAPPHRIAVSDLLAAERIVAVAIRVNGLTVSLPPPARHVNVLKLLRETFGEKRGDALPRDQGFITTSGRYVGRLDAFLIARDNGQSKRTTGSMELFSEDLW
jgi:hypothetical protein